EPEAVTVELLGMNRSPWKRNWASPLTTEAVNGVPLNMPVCVTPLIAIVRLVVSKVMAWLAAPLVPARARGLVAAWLGRKAVATMLSTRAAPGVQLTLASAVKVDGKSKMLNPVLAATSNDCVTGLPLTVVPVKVTVSEVVLASESEYSAKPCPASG